jgi:xylitol oxidase
MDFIIFWAPRILSLTGEDNSNIYTVAVTAMTRTNWAGNYRYEAARVHLPDSVQAVQEIVNSSVRLKAVGVRHSFNSIADSSEAQISLESFHQMTLDAEALTVRLGAGVRYGELAVFLNREGFALHNLASLPHISVVGACATGTHGSGIRNGNLSTAVSRIQMVTGHGELVELSRDHDGERFLAAVVGLGALGVVTAVELNVEPNFEVRQAVYEGLPFAVLEHHLEDVFSLGYSVSLFTDWQNDRATQMWVKRRIAELPFEPELFGALPAREKVHPLPGHPAESCTEQLGVAGPWHQRLPHFRMDFTPSSGEELQTEYFVPLEHGYEAIRAVEVLRDRITPLLFVSELRTVAADHLWLSPCYRRPSLAIHFTWKPQWEAVREVLPLIETALAPFDPRPHWAKLFVMHPANSYARMDDFRDLAEWYDPSFKFRNAYLNAYVF